jgi:hypothetical protein
VLTIDSLQTPRDGDGDDDSNEDDEIATLKEPEVVLHDLDNEDLYS